MSVQWYQSQTIAKVAGHLTDARPAWLWSADGTDLLWRNRASHAFKPKRKAKGELVPIARQIARVIRLGVTGHASLSRLQFTIGEKPVSVTCSCTPLLDAKGEPVLLVVGVDPLDQALLEKEAPPQEGLGGLIAKDSAYVLIDAAGAVLFGSERSRDIYADYREAGDEHARYDVVAMEAGPDGAKVLFFSPRAEREEIAAAVMPAPAEEPGAPAGTGEEESVPTSEAPEAVTGPSGLSELVNRLAEQERLFEPIGEEEAGPLAAAPEEVVEEAEAAAPEIPPERLWRVIGRGFTPAPAAPGAEEPPAEAEPEEAAPAPAPADAETVERVSRYNFDELSRILTDRVSAEPGSVAAPPVAEPEPEAETGRLLNLGDETLILNRLPLGLLVFRDQQILFANRSFAEMTGYDNTASLKQAGLDAIFPAGDTGGPAEPVSHLCGAHGEKVPVAARLHAISWQGQPALLLSARRQEGAPGGEMLVRAFAETLAAARKDGFFETSRAGIISAVSGRMAELYDRSPDVLIGRPVYGLAALNEGAKLRRFLEQPARYAGEQRPYLHVAGAHPHLDLLIFAEGSAGIVTGYFGFVFKTREAEPVQAPATEKADESEIMARVGRGIRRPLNTIIGFSELIRSHAFGPIDNHRYIEYARDIKSAGLEIAALVDEMEQFSKLGAADYLPAAQDFDLSLMLDQCVAHIRAHAGAARVLVRSAISETLPHIRGDQATFSQAVLNLLASAISQTPQGGQVVLSAHRTREGAIEIHIRDSCEMDGFGFEERFMLFRDGRDENGDVLRPVKSAIGLSLTRSLLAVNACSLRIDPTSGVGTLMSLIIPAEQVKAAEAENRTPGPH